MHFKVSCKLKKKLDDNTFLLFWNCIHSNHYLFFINHKTYHPLKITFKLEDCDFLKKFKWKIWEYFLYNPDLSSWDFHVLEPIKKTFQSEDMVLIKKFKVQREYGYCKSDGNFSTL